MSHGPRVLPEVLDRPPQRLQASLGLRGRLLIVRGVSNSTAIFDQTFLPFVLPAKFFDFYLCFTDFTRLHDLLNDLKYLLGFLGERGRLLTSVESQIRRRFLDFRRQISLPRPLTSKFLTAERLLLSSRPLQRPQASLGLLGRPQERP